MRSKYPVGATWEGDEIGIESPLLGKGSHFRNQHRHAKIQLTRRDGKYEVWYWSWTYDDGSGLEFDWGTSYRMCKDSIPFDCRMKRVE